MQKCCLVSGRTITIKVWLLEFSTTRPFDPSTTSLVSSKCLVCCSFIDHSQGLSTQKFAVKSLKMAIHSLKLTASLPRKNAGWKTIPLNLGFGLFFRGELFNEGIYTKTIMTDTSVPSDVIAKGQVHIRILGQANQQLAFRSDTVDGNQKSGDHQLEVGSLSSYVQSFIHSRWLFGISEPSTRGQKYVKRHESQNQSPISPQKYPIIHKSSCAKRCF